MGMNGKRGRHLAGHNRFDGRSGENVSARIKFSDVFFMKSRWSGPGSAHRRLKSGNQKSQTFVSPSHRLKA